MTILEKNKNLKESDTPINALPEYKIRTMEDDLAGKELIELEKEATKTAPPKELPIIEERLPEPSNPEKIKPDREQKRREKQERQEQKKKEEPEKIERMPLPSIEELISTKLSEPPKPKKIKKPKKVKAPKPPKEEKVKEPKQKKSKNWLIWLLIIILVIIIVFAVFYFIGLKPEPEPEPKPLTIPESLIPVNETKLLNLTDSLINLLSQEAKKDQSTQTLKRMVVSKNETEFLSLNELLEKLNINIPPYALVELENSYDLVIYSQNGKKRLGLIVKVKNVNNLNEQLGFWEQTMVNDLQGLFLTEPPGTPATNNFQNNTYKNVNIRYINFPEPDLTIDYAVANNLLILSTSREAIYMIIDKIVDNL